MYFLRNPIYGTGTNRYPTPDLFPPRGVCRQKKNYLYALLAPQLNTWILQIVEGRCLYTTTWSTIMQAALIKSDIQVHGLRYAVDRQVRKFRKLGCSKERAISIAFQLVFGRVVY